MSQPIGIRAASVEDVNPVSALWLGLMRDHEEMDERWRLADGAEERWYNDFRWLVEDDSHLFLVASVAGQIVGFLHAYLWEDLPIYENILEVFVASIYVHPEYRQLGAGKAMVEKAKQWGVEKGAERMRLGVLSLNDKSAAFWEQLGAVPLSVFYTLPLDKSPQPNRRPRQIGF